MMLLFLILAAVFTAVWGNGLGQIGEMKTIRGKLEVVGMDFFKENKHYMFCAFIPNTEEDASLVVLDNVHKIDCHNGVDLQAQVFIRGRPQGDIEPTVQEQKAYVHPENAGHVAEPMNYLHGNLHRILSIDGQSMTGSHRIEAETSNEPKILSLKHQLGTLKEASVKKKSASRRTQGAGLRGGARRLAKASGDSSLLVVRVMLSGDSGSGSVDGYCDETCANDNAWGSDSARASYLQSSYNNLNIRTDLGELRSVSLSTSLSDYSGCDFDKLGDDAIAAVEAGGLSTSSFDMITFYMSKNLNCGFGGVAYVGGVRSWEVDEFVGVLTHELGHSLSVWHAATDPGNDGEQDCEYCDYSCVMGSPNQHITMHAIHRYVLGWIPSTAVDEIDPCEANQECVTQHTLVELQTSPTSLSGNEKLMLKLPRMFRPGDYYVSFRGSSGFDGRLLNTYKNKVSLHYYLGENTELITTLGAGEEYVDSRTFNGQVVEHLTVRVVSISGGQAVVEIDVGEDSLPGCVDITVDMTDSYGDGWNNNQLFFEPSRFISVSLSSGSSGTEIVCLPPGTYSPFACTGTWTEEVGWTITYVEDGQTKTISGGANEACSANYGSFTLTGDTDSTYEPTFEPTFAPTAPTFEPTFSPSFYPTVTGNPSLQPTDAPTGPCTEVTFQLSDSYGDGWNGNYLYFDAAKTIGVTLSSGFGGSGTICLPEGVYYPYACDGSWINEVSWQIPQFGVSGGASSTCGLNNGFFVISAQGCTQVTADLSDSFGDGWNGNELYFDAAQEFSLTFYSGSAAVRTGCLPPGTYTPFACGGGWPEEVSWSLAGFNPLISGGATATCPATPSGNSFTVGSVVDDPTFSPTFDTTTSTPTFDTTTSTPTFDPTTSSPTFDTTTSTPTFDTTTSTPTFDTTTSTPTFDPTTSSPTFDPTTSSPTFDPTTSSPTFDPTTSSPTFDTTTSTPTFDTTTSTPTFDTTTSTPTFDPTTSSPTFDPTTSTPTLAPSGCPSGFFFDTSLNRCLYAEPSMKPRACRSRCSELGSDMLCINSKAESRYIGQTYNAAWIGIYRDYGGDPEMYWQAPCFSTFTDYFRPGKGPEDFGATKEYTFAKGNKGRWILSGNGRSLFCICETEM